MAEDFFVKFSGASRHEYEKKTIIRMTEPHERVEALLPLLKWLVQSETEPGEIHQCPICNQDLKVSFYRFMANPNLGISTYCKTCNSIVLFDSNKMPIWAPKPKSLREALEELEIRGDNNV